MNPTSFDGADAWRRLWLRAAGAAALAGLAGRSAAAGRAPAAAPAVPAAAASTAAPALAAASVDVDEALAPAQVVAPLHRADALDWKQVLLAGERRITMRRDGPATAVRYRLGDGRLDLEGYRAACYLLRDVRAGRMAQIDPQLLDVLCGIQRWMDFTGQRSTIEITSGFRTVQTNDSAEGSGRHSMHLVGKAADIVVPGATSRVIGDMVQRFNHEGGTGIYLGRGFVHVDTGSARTWVTGPAPRPKAAGRRGRRRR
ncbi:YcbK family protein [Piscinibacter sakaiensis]|uniref:Murein endopeptidase K n=1 Tax=Piscinibacter sakaiensis TaxID=1547922 RepID=A0A0K8NYJ8_PISS1|nr:DUF882 domain-containing protein [Piscinibacter sakaiensis]GAP35448.1 exported protein [Piscinibacter sakaiensis]